MFTLGAVQTGGRTVGYRAAGAPDASPVVLLHGGASGSATWDRVAAALVAHGHRTIAVDLRGHGRSSRAPAYPLDGFAADVTGLLDALRLERVALVGHSLGGYAAWAIARRRPASVRRLVLEDPPVPARGPHDAHGLTGPRFLGATLGLLLLRRGGDRRAVISAVRQLRVPDPGWWEGLPGIRTETLVISGGPRSHIPPHRLAAAVDAMPRARLCTIAVGHRIHSTAPERFIDTVSPFLHDTVGR